MKSFFFYKNTDQKVYQQMFMHMSIKPKHPQGFMAIFISESLMLATVFQTPCNLLIKPGTINHYINIFCQIWKGRKTSEIIQFSLVYAKEETQARNRSSGTPPNTHTHSDLHQRFDEASLPRASTHGDSMAGGMPRATQDANIPNELGKRDHFTSDEAVTPGDVPSSWGC